MIFESGLGSIMWGASELPLFIRCVLGGGGLLLIVAGERLYWSIAHLVWGILGMVAALQILTFATVSTALVGHSTWWVGSTVGIVVGLLMGRWLHRVMLRILGGVLGAGLGMAIGPDLGLLIEERWWTPIGVVVGILIFPWIFSTMLKVALSGLGALCVAWAVGSPHSLPFVAVLWLIGTLIQLGFTGKTNRDESVD